MQMQLPLFPSTTKLINHTVGLFCKDDFVYYLHNGSPVYCHCVDDMNSYRYITANMVNSGLCKPIEIANALGVSARNIQRYSKTLREKGADWFFNRKDDRGQCYKMTEELFSDAQELLDKFYSISDIGRLLGVSEGAIRYHIRKGTLKKKEIRQGDYFSASIEDSSLPGERNKADILSSEVFGIGAHNHRARGQASHHSLETTPMHFESCHSLCNVGLLVLIPFLLETGLLSYQSHYEELDKGYYFLDFIILFLSFMYLSRIKNPEQLKHLSPGEFGKLLGVDRIPEAKCLRKKIKQICSQGKSEQWNMSLASYWSKQEENEFYYIDGHVQIYSGSKARLGKKHIARQKLCLPGIQEFWVNNHEGLPYFYVTGQVNEKLLEMLNQHIIPSLLRDIPAKYSQQQLDADADLARFTVVFDREGYSPSYFKSLWETHRVAVITYRKNVKDKWPEQDFQTYTQKINGVIAEMRLSERSIELNGVPMREIRRLTKDGHQTSVITNNQQLTTENIAFYMFSRWTQENFFKYLRQEYDFDRIAQYIVEQIDNDFWVVNPEYNNLCYRLKKLREKINRRRAKLYKLQEENIHGNLDNTAQYIKKQTEVIEELNLFLQEETALVKQRKNIAYKIKIEDMPNHLRYTRLNIESKRFLNIIKMICYRAETSFANLLAEYYKKHKHEKRALVNSIIHTSGDLIADYKNKTLTVKLYTQSNPNMNDAVSKICELLNQTETKFPETNLTLKYKLAT